MRKENEVDAIEQKLDDAIPEKVKTQAEIYDDQIAALKEEVEKMDDVEELKRLRDEVNEETKAFEQELRDKVYELPDTVTFRGTTYKRSKVWEFIADIISQTSVPWHGVLSTFEFIEYWKEAAKNNLKGIPYMYYNTTLRFLGEVQYKGYETMKKILVVNSLLGTQHDEYTLDLSKYYFLNGKFDVYDQRIMAIEALTQPITGEPLVEKKD